MSVIAVVGAGVMGTDIASTLSYYGYNVILKDIHPEVLEEAPRIMRQKIRDYKMISTDLQDWNALDILNRITFTDNYDAFDEVSWVIENITEDLDAKISLYKELNHRCGQDTLFAVNTSCLPITKLASQLSRPDRVIGMHFMNPVPLNDIVETVHGFHTSSETESTAKVFLNSINRQPLLVKRDFPGFVSNRLSHLFMNEAAFLVQEGVADPEQIDAIFRKGYSHKMGPLETADLIGLDTVVQSLKVLFDSYQDSKFRCCPLLMQMVDAGLLGRKSGRGFYSY
ncbi:3-hydroxyacyl-CoA dehydrogenase family protein [Oceanobacillus manasiensis]|uniref:3-hydroxyacyl-CoA dehydrogenase family protein n=1 Tax=Oceanobacillus manasiensis TaxID=586413 RepID=UPI0005A948FA|nr:3-hydroxyacyl-CoA dehydrogenase family protein [Oceanobacillus manasiensis]